jgi:hypothetical protein
MEISMYGRTDSSVRRTKKSWRTRQTHTQKTLGVIHLKWNFHPDLFPSDLLRPSEGLRKLIKRDRWHNLMEISMYGRTDFVRPYRTKKWQTKDKHTHKKTIVHLKELKLNVTDGTIWWKSQCTDGRTSSVRTGNKNDKQGQNKHTENLGGNTSEGIEISIRFIPSIYSTTSRDRHIIN